MIIRDGFVRDVDGRWHNMDHVLRFQVHRLVNKKWVVCVVLSIESVLDRISQEFETEQEAHTYLDMVFGYVG